MKLKKKHIFIIVGLVLCVSLINPEDKETNNIVSIDLQKSPTRSAVEDLFITRWDTSQASAGSSASDQILLPLVFDGEYNFIVDWGDGTTDTITAWDQAEVLHTYTSSGIAMGIWRSEYSTIVRSENSKSSWFVPFVFEPDVISMTLPDTRSSDGSKSMLTVTGR